MLRGIERKRRKKEEICKVKQVDKEDLYILRINCKGKEQQETVANKGINVEKIIIGLKIKIKKKRKEK